ncbi:MAG: iron ABC transporter permease [Candidatus Methanomethylophilaceae archaeon]|nr:iron ABC transporter permease [Candidatus Methanomethylophilaceae archaeon]MDD3378402.1 iron ABC transporter permease [Candidatus Methanomethylophilaceae archaeon]MDY0224009.1 iron ABC transporter permease [Candidatus Methanomethylophilaceae archaeon]
MSLFRRINEISNNEKSRKAWFGFVCAVFLCLIIIPSIFVVLKLFTEWGLVSEVLANSAMMAQINGAVFNSFSIALIVTIIDILVGIPMAWILVRKPFKGKKYLDTLMDMPLAFPTAVLGLSVVMFWGAPDGITVSGLGLVFSPYLMIIMLHIIFTYPYMVRSLSAILEQIEPNYETAAMTLGASKFTAVRTITLPLFRAGLITGFIICFARSLSETGGTYIALQLMGVQNTFFTGPTYIAENMSGGNGPMILISVMMIILALVLLVVAKTLMTRLKIPLTKVWPQFGRKISRGAVPKSKDIFSIAFLLIIVILPSFYIFAYLTQPGSNVDYGMLLYSTGISFLIAGVAVVFDIIFGIPMAMYIARQRNTFLGKILDNMVNIPLIVPTTALGFSLALFWGSLNVGSSWGLVLVIFGHIAFTYPLIVRNITGAVEEVDQSYEEVAMTLGAKPFQAFSKVLMPIIKSSIIAGGILAFTRSLGETGATVAIGNSVQTVPVYIINLVKAQAYPEAAMCSIILIAICFVFMFAVRVITHRGDNNA